jgi:hypothetical protein
LLLTLIFWIILSFAFWGTGRLLANSFGPATMREDYPETSYFFLGLSITGLLSGLAWIFVPVNFYFSSILTGIGIGYGLACLPVFPDINFKRPLFLLIAAIFGVALLIKSSAPTSFYDCGLYYVQTMRWVQNYALVPGLANVHIRFGNASLWHIFSAAYELPGIFKGSFDSIGELMLFWFLCFHAWQVYSLAGFERYLSLGLVIAGLFFTFPMLGAPSPDLACGVLGMHTFWQFRKFLRFWNPKQENKLNTRGLTLFIQSCFLAGIKLSALPFLLIAAVVCFLVIREGGYKQVIKLLVLGMAAGLAMVWRSYILSGFLFFPVFSGNMNPDWKIPDAEVAEYLAGVKGFARHIPSAAELSNGLTYELIASMKFSEWLPLWAAARNMSEWIFMLGGVFGWLLLVKYAGNKIRKQFSSQWPLFFYTWLSGMMLLFWFSNAPDPRFGIAALGSGFSYFTASILFLIESRFGFLTKNSIMHLILVCLALAGLFLYRDIRSVRTYYVRPASYHQPELEEYKLQDGVSGFTPEIQQTNWHLDGDMCWDSPLPCSPNPVPNLQLRGKTFAEGFRKVSTHK